MNSHGFQLVSNVIFCYIWRGVTSRFWRIVPDCFWHNPVRNPVTRSRQNPARSFVESGIIRLFSSIRFGWFRQYPIVEFDGNQSTLFRRNPIRNPTAKIPTKSRSNPTDFFRENIGFRSNSISDYIFSNRILRLDWITWDIVNLDCLIKANQSHYDLLEFKRDNFGVQVSI